MGLAGALLGGVLWGLSGTAAQVLFQHDGLSPQLLLSIRMLGSGAILYAWLRPPLPRRDLGRLILFAVLGLAAVQYTYFAAIDASNAATATLLQYLSLPLVALCDGPTPRRAAGAGVALLGTFWLVGGTHLLITPAALTWGLLSALAAAAYTLSPRRLIAEHGAWEVTTWGLLIGGVATLPGLLSGRAWMLAPSANPAAAAALVAFVVLFGTLLSFGLYLNSLARIRATEAAVAATIEPLTAAVVSLAFLHVVLGGWQLAGGGLILGAIVLLSSGDRPAGRPGRTAG